MIVRLQISWAGRPAASQHKCGQEEEANRGQSIGGKKGGATATRFASQSSKGPSQSVLRALEAAALDLDVHLRR
jgi:hypothetical protein